MRIAVLLAVLVVAGGVLAQDAGSEAPGREAAGAAGVLRAEAAVPQPLVRAGELARVLGAELTQDGGMLVLRGDGTVLTAFDGSPDVYLSDAAAGEEALSAPAELRDDGWWLPLDAGAPFGLVRTGSDTVTDARGRTWTLRVRSAAAARSDGRRRATVLRPREGAVAVELRSAESGPAGATRVAWLADLGLLSLSAPELRATVDAALSDAAGARALLLVVTSQRPGGRAEGVAVDTETGPLLGAGARHETLAGSPDAIGPDAPWIAVVWLPEGTRLDRPLTVRWEGAEAEVTFRR